MNNINDLNPNVEQNISINEINDWANWYETKIPGAPKMQLNNIQKTVWKDKFYLRIPLENSQGMIYFTKTNSLQAFFIRQNFNRNNSTMELINTELIDLNTSTYKTITYKNNIADSLYTFVLKSQEQKGKRFKTDGNFWFDLGCVLTFGIPQWNNGRRVCAYIDWDGLGTWLAALFDLPDTDSSGDGNAGDLFASIMANFPQWSNPSSPIWGGGSNGQGNGTGTGSTSNSSIYNDLSEAPFIWQYIEDDGSSFTDFKPHINPNFQFDANDGYEAAYPNFTNMVKNLKTFVKSNVEVLNALQKWSGLSKQTILENLTFGQGPVIKIEEMTGRFAFYNKNSSENILHVRASYVRGLEQSQLSSTKQATAFLLAVSILHEYVHFGTALNNISEGKYDFGLGFERDAFNIIIDDDNAGNVVIKFSKYF